MKFVSAIMPTRGRKAWSQKALECFLNQDYPEKELIILQDEDEPSFDDQFLHYPGVFLCGNDERLNIPQKRNEAARLAEGEIIMHFDSDDWSASNRMAKQVQILEESGKALTGFHSLLFYLEPTKTVMKYVNDAHFACGTSLAYLRSWWQAHPFNESLAQGEDNEMVKIARQQDQLMSVDGDQLMVARIHDGNTDVKNIAGLNYKRVPLEALPKEFFV